MKKKVIRLTESDVERLVKKIISEVGGYDDPNVMGLHYGNITKTINHVFTSIIDMVNKLNVVLAQKDSVTEEEKQFIVGSLDGLSLAIEECLSIFKKLSNEITENELRREILKLIPVMRTFKKKIRTLLVFGHEMPYSEFRLKVGLISKDLVDYIMDSNILDVISKTDQRFLNRFKNL